MSSAPTTSIDPAIKRVLIVFPSWVGDTVMATPFLRAMRTIPAFAEAHFSGYMRPGLDEIVDGLPGLNETIVGRPSGLLGPLFQGTELGRQRFDAAVLLPNSFRLALTLLMSGIPKRTGYHRDGRGMLLTDPVSCPVAGGWKEPISAVDYYLHLAEHLGAASIEDRTMELHASPEQHAAADHLLENAGVERDEPIALLNPGANRADKRWLACRFAQLADHLSKTHGLRILVNGSPGERKLVGKITEMASCDIINLPQHRVTLGSLKGICTRCRLVVSNDTGTRHLAAGIANGLTERDSKPHLALVSLFGPTRPEWAQIDYENEAIISTDGGPIDGITFDAVREACDGLLT